MLCGLGGWGFGPFNEHVNAQRCKYEVFPEEVSVLVKFLGNVGSYIRYPGEAK